MVPKKVTLYLWHPVDEPALTHALDRLAALPCTASLPSCSEQHVMQQIGESSLHICNLDKDSTQW